MSRKPRFFVPGLPVHIVQRGNNRQVIFFEEMDYAVYRSWLAKASHRFGCEIHAYVLMTNHTHILATPREAVSVSKMMQHLGRHYVPYINRKYERTGTLWEGRFRAATVETSAYLLACYRYIELNPCRAGMVQHPQAYRWSSYQRNGLLSKDDLITPHPEYQNLGSSDEKRAVNYRRLFEQGMSRQDLKLLRVHTQSGTPLGGSNFREQIERALNVKTGQSERGRPRKPL